MALELAQTDSTTETDEFPYVSQESLVLRNYDGTEANEVTIRLVDSDESVTFDGTYALRPGSSKSIHVRLDRGVYVVEACLNGGKTDRAECLIGSGPDETALVEVGNGLVSVVEGVI
ncbi:hypothetical protein ACERIT_05340 [Halopenitus sp. H-Gu1]|uniref:hypothetical protein n=1 Tax=Halopenitus sp. H-Gu1 TaxID=3242697 RepID=UPI00359D3B8E